MSGHEQLSFLNEVDLAALTIEIEAAAHQPVAKDLATQLREFHGWTIDKLEILRLYLRGGYVRIAGGGTYIDGFAGQGEGEYRGALRDGSAVVAAESDAFRALHLIEQDPTSNARLRDRLEQLAPRLRKRCYLHPASDCNIAIPELLDGGVIDRTKPCFAFLDPNSTELAWTTVERLAAYKTLVPKPDARRRPAECKVELWILFNTHQAIYRLWTGNRTRYPDSMSPATLDHVMGGRDAWWDLWESRQPSVALLQRYVDRLYALGYTYVLPQPIRDPEDGRIHYYMIHATDHPSALGLMRWAKRQTGRIYATELPGIDQF